MRRQPSPDVVIMLVEFARATRVALLEACLQFGETWAVGMVGVNQAAVRLGGEDAPSGAERAAHLPQNRDGFALPPEKRVAEDEVGAGIGYGQLFWRAHREGRDLAPALLLCQLE